MSMESLKYSCPRQEQTLQRIQEENDLFSFSNSIIEVIYRIEIWKNALIIIRMDIIYQFISLFNYDETKTLIIEYKWWS